MIEGLILMAELAAVALLLWTVHRRDASGGKPSDNLFAYQEPDRPPADGGEASRKRNDA